jgi:hypothetical protein
MRCARRATPDAPGPLGRALLVIALCAAATLARADLATDARGDRAGDRGGRRGGDGARCSGRAGIFAHGDGRSERADGSRYYLPSVFAQPIIEAELAGSGLSLEHGAAELTRVRETVEYHRYHRPEDRERLGELHTNERRERALPVDGYDRAAQIGYVYLDAAHWRGLRERFADLPREWDHTDLRALARDVAAAAAREPRLKFLAVFYDPLVAAEHCEGVVPAADCGRTRAEELLRAQARDFAACLASRKR